MILIAHVGVFSRPARSSHRVRCRVHNQKIQFDYLTGIGVNPYSACHGMAWHGMAHPVTRNSILDEIPDPTVSVHFKRSIVNPDVEVFWRSGTGSVLSGIFPRVCSVQLTYPRNIETGAGGCVDMVQRRGSRILLFVYGEQRI